MSFINNITTVARYEARTLRRSWFFRLFSLGALTIFTFMNIGVFSPVGDEDWDLVAIPSSVPLINLYLLNVGQAIVVIFLAADFLKRDKKLDTNEVLYTRSMSNLEYISGKTFGILRLFLGLNVLILLIALIINITSTKMHVDITSYFAYLLIIPLPTILFSLGLAFLMMSVIRNQALTFLLLLGIAALDMFYMWHRFGGVLDYMAFGLPIFKSQIIGFDDPEKILYQRGLFFSMGIAFVCGTVLLFKRLPQSKLHTLSTAFTLVIFTVTGGFCAFQVLSEYNRHILLKKNIIEVNRKYENRDFAEITQEKINIEHLGETIKSSAEITIRNDNVRPLDSYIFSLNPSLQVSAARTRGGNSVFNRDSHILEITPGRSLGTGMTDTVLISYEGGIDESFCYPDYSDNPKENPYRIAMVNVNKRQAFLTEDYVLLTPESHWYPVTALNYYPSNPARIKVDFTDYSLKVKNTKGLVSLSQGVRIDSADSTTFVNESPLTGITLAIGNYLVDTLTIDSLKYFTYYFPGHDYYKKDLSEIKDTLGRLVSGFMRDLETNFSTPFPFRTLSLVEVPVQFYSYPRQNTQTRAEVQPAMVLIPEKLSTLWNTGFAKRFSQQKKQMERNNQVITDKELQVRIFNDFIRNTFISGVNSRYINGVPVNEPGRYRLGPSFYFFKNNFYSPDYQVINTVFESHLQKIYQPDQRPWHATELVDNDRANLILKEIPFSELLKINPKGDTLRIVVTSKGDWLFNLFRSKAGIEKFNNWFMEYLDENKFQKVSLDKLNSDVEKEFGFEFYPYLENWFGGKEQPGFIISDLKLAEVIVNSRTRYNVIFKVINPEPVAGLFNVAFRTEEGPASSASSEIRRGGSGTMQGTGLEADDIAKIVYLGPAQAKRIGILMDYQPRSVMINTIFSRNVPEQINLPLNDVLNGKESPGLYEGEEILPSIPLKANPSEIIVDNEDPGFKSGNITDNSLLKKWLGINTTQAETYETIRTWYVPEFWQKVVHATYYGKYILSAVYTRPSRTPERSIIWTTPLTEPGYYDIYAFIGKVTERVTVRSGGSAGAPSPQGDESLYRDMHYRVHNDEGVEEIIVDYNNAESGWNNIGRYYLSGDTAKIELTNQSQGRIVTGDAVKWVRHE